MISKCRLCNKTVTLSQSLPFCAQCIRAHFDEISEKIQTVHRISRAEFGLPEMIPREGNQECKLCINRCKPAESERGFCGIPIAQKGHLYYQTGTKTKAVLKWYYDALPTNCVADWVCAGCTGAGYPAYAYRREAEYGHKNLAVFYEACNFNCLFCQNWQYKYSSPASPTFHR